MGKDGQPDPGSKQRDKLEAEANKDMEARLPSSPAASTALMCSGTATSDKERKRRIKKKDGMKEKADGFRGGTKDVQARHWGNEAQNEETGLVWSLN